MNPKLLIVTNLGVLKAHKLTTTPRGSLHLDQLETLVLDEAHHRLVERVTDSAGRRAAPTHKRWGAPVADDRNLKLETKRRLIKKIAGHIERLIVENRDCDVRLAAHRKINHLIISSLSPAVRQRIEINLVLDLVHVNERKLIKCFAPQMLVNSSKKYERLESH